MKTSTQIAAVVVAGTLLGAFILRSHPPGEAGHDHDDEAGHAAAAPSAPAAQAASAASAPIAAPRTRFSDEQLRHNGVLLAAAGPARLSDSLQLPGEVQLDPDRSMTLAPRLAARVETVHARAGDRVQRGQLLAVLSSPALADQRAELLAARKRLALARATHDREKQLWEAQISAEQDYLAARAAWQEADIAAETARQKLVALGAGATDSAGTQGLTRLELRAPISGVVLERKLQPGEVLAADAPAFQLADLGTVWVTVAVPARDLPRLTEGMAARVSAHAFEAQGEARLASIGTLVGTQARAASARLVLANPKGLWRPGLPVTVALQAAPVDVPVAVPQEAVQTLDGAPVVFVRQGQTFEARRVETGRSDARQVEIVRGLVAGERFAARNSFVVKADLGKAEAEHAH